jgi:hypothetical protein
MCLWTNLPIEIGSLLSKISKFQVPKWKPFKVYDIR